MNDSIRKVAELVQLDFDAVKAYEQAIENIEEQSIRLTLQTFKRDHERHIEELSAFIREEGETPPERSRDLKGFVIQGMTSLQSKMGTKAALMAMKTNEKFINKCYRDALDDAELPPGARAIIKRNYEDEQRHLQYIQHALDTEIWHQDLDRSSGQVSSF